MLSKMMSVYNSHLIGQEELFTKFEQHSIDLSDSCKSVFQYLVRFGLRYLHVDVSQSRIANDLRLTRETVNRAIKHLTKIKFISTQYRYKKTSYYYLSPFFRDETNRARLRYIFKQFKAYLSRRLLLSKNNPIRKESNVTLIRELVSYIYIPEVVSSSKRVTYNVESSEHPLGAVLCKPTRTVIKKRTPYMVDEAIITPAIRRATDTLNLTKWGQIKLMAFPDEAIDYGLGVVKSFNGNGKDPFSCLVNTAIDYCKAQNIPVTWKKFFFLKDVYKMPSDARYTLNQAKASPARKYSPEWQPRPEIQESPEQIVRDWEEWVAHPGFKQIIEFCNPVSPHFAMVLVEGHVVQSEIDRLYATYPFLKKFMQPYIDHYQYSIGVDPEPELIPVPKDPTKDIMQRLAEQVIQKNKVWRESVKEKPHEGNDLHPSRVPNPPGKSPVLPSPRVGFAEAGEVDMWPGAPKTAQEPTEAFWAIDDGDNFFR